MKTNTYEPQKMISITIRNNINLLSITCDYIEDMVTRLGMPEEKIKAIRVLTENILKRRIINAYKDIGEITLDIYVSLDRIIVEISDKGTPYWVDIEKDLENLKYKADSYQLKKLGVMGQSFSFCFYLEPEIDVLKYKKQDSIAEELMDSNLYIRPVKPEENEIIEVIKCIHNNYGYGYINHKVYDIELMKAILKEGKQWSYIGVNDHDQIMAHISLAFHEDFPKMPEIGGLVCKEFCRGHNVAGRMVNAMCNEVTEGDVNGIFGMPVAFHPVSQKLLTREGFVPSGIVLHYVTPESAGAYVDGDRRLDVFTCAKLFNKGRKLKLSVPEEHRGFVRDFYGQFDIECDFVPSVKPSGDEDFRMTYDSEIGIGTMFIENASPDFENDLTEAIKEFNRNKIAMAEAYINMSNPSAEWVYNLLREKGFFFSGIMPGSSKGEYILMQNLFGSEVEWDKLVAIEGYTDILNYVREHI